MRARRRPSRRRAQVRQLTRHQVLRSGLGEPLERLAQTPERQVRRRAVGVRHGRQASRQIDVARASNRMRSPAPPAIRSVAYHVTGRPRRASAMAGRTAPAMACWRRWARSRPAAWSGTAIDSGPSRLRCSSTAGQPNSSSSRPSTSGYAAGSRRRAPPCRSRSPRPRRPAIAMKPPPRDRSSRVRARTKRAKRRARRRSRCRRPRGSARLPRRRRRAGPRPGRPCR